MDDNDKSYIIDSSTWALKKSYIIENIPKCYDTKVISIKSSPVHEAPLMSDSGKGYIVRSLMLFPQLKPVISRSYDNNFTVALRLSFSFYKYLSECKYILSIQGYWE